LEYIEEVRTFFARNFFQKIAERTLTGRRFSFLRGKRVSLNAIAVSENKIKKLNREYRGKNTVTDILSFGEHVSQVALMKEKQDVIFLGEIFFCPKFIIRQTKSSFSREVMPVVVKAGKTVRINEDVLLKKEMAYIFSHGILHLIGFNHEKEMFGIQEKISDIF